MLNFKHDYKSEERFLKSYKKMLKKELKALSPRPDQPSRLPNPNGNNPQNPLSSMPNVQSMCSIDSLALANRTREVKPAANTSHQPALPIYTSGLLEPTREPPKDVSSTSVTTLNRQDSTNDMFSSSLDPFNDMELKTINDLEELKTILNNQQMVNDLQQQQRQKQQQPTQENSLNPVPDQNQGRRELPHTTSQDNFGLPKISFVDNDIYSK